MLVVFEGIDGCGKTTISNLVGKALRESGLGVSHVREGGRFASPVAQSIREFARDQRNLELTPFAELLLNVAREAQLFDEITRPALGTADVVIADRFFHSAEVLARFGRGLGDRQVRAIIDAASRGIAPDLVILIDVDPNIARARRRISKILAPDRRSPSRKGQAGVGLTERMREGYRKLAARDPARWIVIDNSSVDMQATVDLIAATIRRAWQRGAPETVREMRARTPPPAPRPTSLPRDSAAGAFLRWVDRRARTEPTLAAYMLAGLTGPAVALRRVALADRAPEIVAFGLLGLGDPESWRLRRMLALRAPRQVARSLGFPTPDCPDLRQLRASLAGIAPEEVLASTAGADDRESFALRASLYGAHPDAVMASLRGLDGPKAWQIRERWLAENGGDLAFAEYETAMAACRSVTGLDCARSWEIRETARVAAPTEALASLAGMTSDRAWQWRERSVGMAPKTVLPTLRGLDDPRAWALRETAAPRCREAIDSAFELDGPRSWRLRETFADVWPGAVLKSLGRLATRPQGIALVARQLERHPDDVSVLKHAAALPLQAALGRPAKPATPAKPKLTLAA